MTDNSDPTTVNLRPLLPDVMAISSVLGYIIVSLLLVSSGVAAVGVSSLGVGSVRIGSVESANSLNSVLGDSAKTA